MACTGPMCAATRTSTWAWAVAHVSAWTVFATHRGGWEAGVIAGLLFSAGMLIASTADSQLISRVLRSAGSEAAASRLRRGIGWFVVILSFGVVIQAVVARLDA